MINRFPTKCTVCGNKHTLRITLGTEPYQEHTFECTGCGEEIRVGLEIHEEKIHFENMPGITGSRTTLKTLQHCELCEEEGIIINLDPNFLISEDLIHKDNIFPWMYEARKVGILEKFKDNQLPLPFTNDIFTGIGGIRNLKEKFDIISKAWRLNKKGKKELSNTALESFWKDYSPTPLDLNECVILLIGIFVGEERCKDLKELITFLAKIKSTYPEEYIRFKNDYKSIYSENSLEKHVEHIKEYVKGFDQFNQALLYATRKKGIPPDTQASSKDFRLVKMFYGNLFEDVTANYFVPACLNNINSGRPYDQFLNMDLKKYLTINKANRHKPFEDVPCFSTFLNTVDSTLRNASHHGAIRVSSNTNVIEYRSGDSGNWKKMQYSEYLYKCNEIMITSMYLFSLQLAIVE